MLLLRYMKPPFQTATQTTSGVCVTDILLLLTNLTASPPATCKTNTDAKGQKIRPYYIQLTWAIKFSSFINPLAARINFFELLNLLHIFTWHNIATVMPRVCLCLYKPFFSLIWFSDHIDWSTVYAPGQYISNVYAKTLVTYYRLVPCIFLLDGRLNYYYCY